MLGAAGGRQLTFTGVWTAGTVRKLSGARRHRDRVSLDLLSRSGEDRDQKSPDQRTPGGAGLSTWWLWAGGLVAVVARLPYLRTPLRSDEGGFLLVGSQWRAGTSLYGDYWVDRPPLLVAFYSAADWLGGATALRIMGCGLAFSVVLLAHLLGRSLTRGPSPWPAVLAVALVAMPYAGAMEVNGELIAAPLVLLGLIAAVRAAEEPDAVRRWWRWAAAGALGVGAAMVKQNFVDVLVFSGVLVLATAWAGRRAPGRVRGAVAGLSAIGVGGGVVGAAVVLGAWTRGTTPAGLWDALVIFRLDAGRVIADSATSATDVRLQELVLAMCLSGSVALLLVFVVHAVGQRGNPLVLAASALLAWELVGVLAGGSYWLHYLVGLIPGLVTAVALMAPGAQRTGPAARMVVRYAAVAALVTAVGALVVSPPSHEVPAAASWLREHARPGDTGTVLYGAPDVLQAARLTSPYPQLWSLPVRVRDPDLAQLTSVLRGAEAPTWLLASHELATWGVSSGPAYAVVTQRYEPVATVDGYTVYHLRHPHA